VSTNLNNIYLTKIFQLIYLDFNKYMPG
ncbi:uncharacterized protein METZ01_LOCUS392471, partial [marine metagenome]